MRERTSWAGSGHRLRPAAILGALLLLVAPIAGADWLVLRDGTRVETQGEWEVKSRLVVFHQPTGKLASLRLSEVDLEASRAATAEAVEAARLAEEKAKEPEEPPERREPVLVLTDADVGHVDPATLEPAGPAERAAPRVVLYATSWCGFCRKTRTLLASLGVPYLEKDIERDPAAGREFYQRFGRVGVPVLDLDGRIVRGFNEQVIRAAVADLQRRAAQDSGT